MDQGNLSSIIKHARDKMRTDPGLSTDVDRIPQLSWILFLKAFDDLEKERTLLDPNYREAIEKPYRWRDWAANEEKGLTGDELMGFVNNELFPYLRSVVGLDEKDQRSVIAEVFRELYNSMRSGHLLREIVDLVNKIDFTSSDDIHTMAHLYESMLEEMRDAAGSNGEFYTPRPVIRLIVSQIKPQIGEKILDPALGTGGFLTEAYEYMKNQQKRAEDRETLQYHTLFGVEKKPMPYLLGMMNLLLHGIEKPNIKRDNSLRTPLYEITERDRVDVVMTNPPFGGEEEKGIMSNFPETTRTSETALLFIQYIMRKLKGGGRCGMVVHNGTLSATGVGARIKKDLIESFNLHTIVRLPKGVFAPYAGIETNILFFDKDGPTKEIWYYEHPLPSERRKLTNPCYTKKKPLRYEEFLPLQSWWNSRRENEYAWRVSVERVARDDYNLDIVNPNKEELEKLRLPEEILDEIIAKEKGIYTLIGEIQEQIRKGGDMQSKRSLVALRDLVRYRKEFITIDDSTIYKRVTAKLRAQGIVLRDEIDGRKIKTKKQQVCKAGDFLVAEIDAKVGGFGIVPDELEGAIVSSHYYLFEIDENKLNREYLEYFVKTSYFQKQINARGSTNYAAIRPEQVLGLEILLPSLREQEGVASLCSKIEGLRKLQSEAEKDAQRLESSILNRVFSDTE